MGKVNAVRLVALTSGEGKNGNWYRVILKKIGKNGKPVVNDFWLTESVGRAAIEEGLIDDVDVFVTAGFDEFLRFQIVEIRAAHGIGGDELDAETNLFD